MIAIMEGVSTIMMGNADVVIAGGMESMRYSSLPLPLSLSPSFFPFLYIKLYKFI